MPVLFLENMPTRLTVPTLQRTRVASAVQVEKAAIPEAAAQVNSIIPESNRLVVPSLPCRDGKGKKKQKKNKKTTQSSGMTSIDKQRAEGNP